MIRTLVLSLMLAGLALGCGSGSTDPDDVIPPFGLIDLRATKIADTFVLLAWTAPGDDDRVGTASRYEVRYVTSGELTDATWPGATRVGGVPSPLPAGGDEVVRIEGLSADTAYRFGVRTVDDNGNVSPLSNVVSLRTAAVPVQFLVHIGKGGAVGDPSAEEPFFLFPRHIAIDRQGRAFIADERNNRVQRFDKELQLSGSWGTSGDGPGAFQGTYGVGLNSDDRVFVTDTGNSRVQRFSASGMYQRSFGSAGSTENHFTDPRGVAVTLNNRVYVADANRVQEFTANGVFVQVLPEPDALGWDPAGLAVTEGGTLYVTDLKNHRVLRMSPDGALEASAGQMGSGPGQFLDPVAVAVDPRGWVLVADLNNHRVQVFTADLEFRFAFGEQGGGPGDFEFPHGIAVDSQRRVWVVEAGNNRLSLFDFP